MLEAQHVLTVPEMPSHNHKVQKNRGGGKDIIAAL